MKILIRISATVLIGLLLIGCGGGGSSSATETITGKFIDAPVEGLTYECSSGLSDTTNANGDFTCNEGDTVTFNIGELILGSALVESIITPFHLYDDLEKVYNVSQLLHSLDEDSDPDTNITLITEPDLSDVNISADSDTFQNELASALASVSRVNYDRNKAAAKMLYYISANSEDYNDSVSVDLEQELESLRTELCDDNQLLVNGECEDADFTLSSVAISNGELLDLYKCEDKSAEGIEKSIPIAWSNMPASTGSLAVIMHHYPHTDDNTTVNSYLLLWGIDPSVNSIGYGEADDGAWYMGGNKDDASISYSSPCSPSAGTHEYTITAYALSETPPSLPTVSSVDVNYSVLKSAIDTVTIIDTATLTFNDVTE